jgi:predicted nucleotidyltransferase
MDSNIKETVKSYFMNKDNVLLVFIFGSFMSGRLTSQSDIDIAVLFDKKPDFHEILKLTGLISEEINREVDIVVLNESSPIIRMQVLKTGELILKKDNRSYENFFVKTVKDYEDLKYIRAEAEANILRGRIYA